MKALFISFFCTISITSFSQTIIDSIKEEDVEKHINFLASDLLKGRVNFTIEQLEAANYISKEFSSCNLLPLSPYSCYYQPFLNQSGHFMPVYSACDTLVDTVLYNIVGMLPGRTRSDEFIIFCAHYDHVNSGLMGETGEIFNGANDDASGTTAVLMLAKYFSMRNDNERTIIFCLFAGEEIGLLGSTAFAELLSPEKIKTVINIEMIGKTNRSGNNGFIVTGSAYSDFDNILRKNLKGGKVKVRNEGSDIMKLFSRSDNFSFAKKGVAAHSIICSDDNDPCYHKPCDDPKLIDTKNMSKVIQAIAKGCTTLINGTDTPKRIKL
jgi:Peptidase family M28